jgi:hypothetical protein
MTVQRKDSARVGTNKVFRRDGESTRKSGQNNEVKGHEKVEHKKMRERRGKRNERSRK